MYGPLLHSIDGKGDKRPKLMIKRKQERCGFHSARDDMCMIEHKRGKTPHSGQVEHFNFHYIGSNVICLVQPSKAILTVISIPI